MQAITNLLCAVDLSDAAAQALRYAVALRSVLNGRLTILHVRPERPGPVDASLATFVSRVVAPEPSIQVVEGDGEPDREILGTVATIAPDVIVMGSHGRTGLQRLVVGSVADRVVRQSSVPVLTVPAAWRPPDAITIATVLCAVDLGEHSHEAVGYAAAIAAAAHARLVVSHVLEWSEEVETKPGPGTSGLPSSEDDAVAGLNRLLTDEIRARCVPEVALGYGYPADDVLRLVQERRADLVVLGIRRRNPVDLAVFGSTARQLIRRGPCPVLTVPVSEGTEGSRDSRATSR
jgi:nucleotide-binding universal stress UspA family protein